jgi:acyl carrier protein
MEKDQILKEVREYVLNEFFFQNKERYSDGLNLFDSGHLDSLAVMRLAFFMEKKFGVIIPPFEFTQEDFSSVHSLVSVIEKHLKKSTTRE